MLPSKITPEQAEGQIADVRYYNDGTLTIAVVECFNGFKAVGYSAPVNPNDYDMAKGRAAAKGRAMDQVYTGMAYQRHEQHLPSPTPVTGIAGMVWSTPSEAL